MNILIVQPGARPDPRGYPTWSSDVGMYVASIQAGGHTPSLICPTGYDENELRAAYEQHTPRIIIIHTISRQADQARAIGAFFATRFKDTITAFAGPHPSAWPADCMNVAEGVYALRGPCEHLLTPFADALEKDGDFFSLPGLSFPVLNRFYHNQIETPPLLEARPLPDRIVTDYASKIAQFDDSIGAEIDTSRSVYYASDRAQACFDLSQPKTGIVPPFQQRPPYQVVAEANALKSDMPEIRFVGFRDEHCLARPMWVKELCSMWPSQVGLPFWACARPEFLTESIFEALANAGCFRLHVMLESGAEHVRRNVLGRRVSTSHLLYVARSCRRFGISLILVNELGFPGETEDMVNKTIDMNKRMHPDWALCTIFHPEPGTALYQRAESKKWLTPSAYGVFYDPDVRVEQPWNRNRKIDKYLKSFNEHVYADSK